jgi:alpha-galactosidase
VDDNWMEPKRAANGSLVFRADKFPRGMKVLADHAHKKGLKFGICECDSCRSHSASCATVWAA